MSLRTLHFVFILAAIVVAFGAGWWMTTPRAGELMNPGQAGQFHWGCNILGALLVLYGIWFCWKKFGKEKNTK